MIVHAEATSEQGERAPLGTAPRGLADSAVAGSVTGAGKNRGTGTLVTAAQLADRWQVPVRTVYAWAKRNSIPHYRAGRLLRFDPVEVDEHFRGQGFADRLPADPDRPGESAFDLLSA